MLINLMKYNLKSLFKSMTLIYIILFISCIFLKITSSLDVSAYMFDDRLSLAQIVLIVIEIFFSISTAVAWGFSFIICIKKFYDSVLKNEGYLTNTLPVKKSTIILSHLFSSFIIQIVTYITLIVCNFILNPEQIHSFIETIVEASKNIEFYLLIILFIISLLGSILAFFCTLSLGHAHDNHKVIYSFLYGTGIFILTSIIGVFVLRFLLLEFPKLDSVKTILMLIVVSSIYSALYYFVTHYSLSKRLNLE